MAKKSKNKRINVVYSTNPDFDYQEDDSVEEVLPMDEQKLYIQLDRKNRKGKTATVITGFVGSDDDANDLSKKLKQYCGVGGGYKNGELFVQGDHKKKVGDYLIKLGAKVKFKGG